MRVLLVNDVAPGVTGGAEVYLDTIATALEALGDEVELLAGEIVHDGWRRVLDLWDPAAARTVAARARAVDADVVHHHNVVRELSVAVVRATPWLPTAMTLHDFRLLGRGDAPDRGVRGAVQRWVKRPLDQRVATRSVDLTIAVSDAVGEAATAAGFRGVEVLPQPVAAPHRPPDSAGDGGSVLFVGRLSADKGVPELLELARSLARTHPDVPVEVVGDGPLAADVAAAARDLPALVVHGALDRAAVSEAYRRARVVVVPSRAVRRPEGGSLVAVEAARHGRPVVVGADAAVRAVALPLGHATATDGSADQLAGAVAGLLDDADEATRRGESGRVAAHLHDPVEVARRLHALHARAIADHGARTGPGGRR